MVYQAMPLTAHAPTRLSIALILHILTLLVGSPYLIPIAITLLPPEQPDQHGPARPLATIQDLSASTAQPTGTSVATTLGTEATPTWIFWKGSDRNETGLLVLAGAIKYYLMSSVSRQARWGPRWT